MRAVVQKVCRASVSIASEPVSAIQNGLLVYLGIFSDDTEKDVDYIVDKTLHLRVFTDDNGINNLSLIDVGGELLIVSQFTLCADARHGRRPSYSDAARPEYALPLYQSVLKKCSASVPVKEGRFREHMHVESVNDGPITILLDSKKLF